MRCQFAIAGLRLVVGLITLGVAVASGQTTAGEADRMASPERLRVGVSFDIPGMGYKNPQTGQVQGFEADLARAIGQQLLGSSEQVDFWEITDEQRIPALQNDRVDMVVSQLTITPERQELVDFSIPYHVTREALLVLQGSNIRGLQDLAGKRIAVTAGSVSLERMRASLPSLPGAVLVITPLSFGNLEAVAQGKADAGSNDLINLTMMQRFADPTHRFHIIDIGDSFPEKPFGIGVKKGRKLLLERLNEAIRSLEGNGDIDRILKKNMAAPVQINSGH